MSPLKIYKASAGSGKTYALTLEYLRLLFLYPGKHRHILAVTFTNRAAGEMKTRILTWLHRISRLGPAEDPSELRDLLAVTGLDRDDIIIGADRLLNIILNDYGYFSVGTIDRFFQSVIRAFTRELGIQPGYNLELDSSKVLGNAVDEMLSRLDNDPELQEWLIRYAEERIENARGWNFREDIVRLGEQLFREEFQALGLTGDPVNLDKLSLKKYSDKLFAFEKGTEARISSFAGETESIIAREGFSLSDFNGGSRSVAVSFQAFRQDSNFRLSESRLEAIAVTSKWLKKDSPPGLEQLVTEKLQPALGRLYEMSVLLNSCSIIRKNLYTMGILNDIANGIRTYARDRNLFLISDASRFLKGIIATNPTPFIFERVGIRFENIMLDEFQDTSLFQWENFRPLIDNSLAAGEDDLLVGDIKQSIYRWRNSDWRILSRDVIRDFSHQDHEVVTLSNNFRSRENIIKFNNSLFQVAPVIISDALADNIAIPGKGSGEFPDPSDIFKLAYSDVIQQLPESKDSSGGYVNCKIFSGDNTRAFYNSSLESLPSQIEELESAGYRSGDIAILVRKQDEGSMVAGKLLEYVRKERPSVSIRLVSNESLIISGNMSVRLIIAFLRFLIFPTDPINCADLKYLYVQFIDRLDKPLNEIFNVRTGPEEILPAGLMEQLPLLKKLPLYELIERIIFILGINERKEDIAYVQALQDLVIGLQREEPVSLYVFLSYWDEKGYKRSITVSEDMDAIRILTIHKAKGLQFRAVIIPFCNWEITTDPRKENILWCRTEGTPFDDIPMVPLRFGNPLKESIFNAYYYDELVKGYLDNLNLLYVAFTRAIDALIIGLPGSENGRLKTVGDLVLRSFNVTPSGRPALENWTGILKGDSFKVGEAVRLLKPLKEREDWELDHYPVFIRDEKLNVRLKSQDYFLDQEGLQGSRIWYGNIMHEIFSYIKTEEDVEFAVRQVLRQGVAGHENENNLVDMVRKSLKQPGISRWFVPGLKVIRERDILTGSGSMYRPDRVVAGDNYTEVVDFKFGDIMKSEYLNQVRTYTGLLRSMGYPEVKGFIWYVTLNKVIDVDHE